MNTMSSAVPIDISYQQQRNGNNTNQQHPQQQQQGVQRFRRESMAHSQGMGGVSWGGVSVGSWLRDEVIFNNIPNPQPMAHSPQHSSSYLPNLEANFCRDYSCCGLTLPNLHDLLRHYEEAHISPSPPVENPVIRRMQSLEEAVSTNEVFLSPVNSNQGVDLHQQHHPHHQQQQLHQQQQTATPMMIDDEDDACIDDPARHLYVMERGEHKPFKCPVIGCDKTYKNQNGLKYHRLHGHQNQTLLLNDDGTYSIIDPLSNEPYPEGMGMEQDKPYRCEVCGKRYKNLNGLKYHRGHSTH